jgi:hypothetical protein
MILRIKRYLSEAFLAGGIMKALKIIIVVSGVLSAAVCQAAGLTRTVSVRESILSKSLSLDSYLSKRLDVKGEEGDLRGNIYEFHSKSPLKAFALSLIVPGAGQYYTGYRIKAAAFLGADIALWSGYLAYHQKGAGTERDYKAYADNNYHYMEYFNWWSTVGADTSVFSHRIYLDSTGSQPIRTREYYENIGKYDQFQVGWGNSGINHPPPIHSDDTTRTTWYGDNNERLTYLNMRKKSNDYFSNAKAFLVVSIGNHIISAFEAAIGARRYNRGGKQYSLELQPYNINGRVVPMAVATTKF